MVLAQARVGGASITASLVEDVSAWKRKSDRGGKLATNRTSRQPRGASVPGALPRVTGACLYP